MRPIAALLLLALLLPQALFAQSQPASSQSQVSAEPAVTQYSLPPDKLVKATALYHTRIFLTVVGGLWSFIVLVMIVLGKVGGRFRNWAERLSRFRFLQSWAFVPLLILTLSVLDLPLEAY